LNDESPRDEAVSETPEGSSELGIDRADLAADIVIGGVAAALGSHDPGTAATIASFAAAFKATWTAERHQRLNEFGNRATAGFEMSAFLERLTESPEFRDLFVQAAEAAAETGWQAKRVILGRVVRQAAADDAFIDEGQVLKRATGAIESREARVLTLLAVNRTNQEGEGQSPGVAAVHLADLLGPQAWAVQPVAATLLREGVIRAVPTYDGDDRWEVTRFGVTFLQWLLEAEDELGLTEDEKVASQAVRDLVESVARGDTKAP
jgi:hypothetical protein